MNFKAAEEYASHAIRNKPRLDEPYIVLAEALEGQNKRDEALAVLKEGSKNCATSLSLPLALASKLSDWGLFDEAIAACRIALDRDPQSASAQAKLDELLRRSRQSKDGTR